MVTNISSNDFSTYGIHHKLIDEAGGLLSVTRLQPVTAADLTSDEAHKLAAIESTPHTSLARCEFGEMGLHSKGRRGVGGGVGRA